MKKDARLLTFGTVKELIERFGKSTIEVGKFFLISAMEKICPNALYQHA